MSPSHRLLPLSLVAVALSWLAVTAAPAAAADTSVREATLIVFSADGGEPERISLGDRLAELAEGDFEEVVTAEGEVITITRTARGFDLVHDGETTSISLGVPSASAAGDDRFLWVTRAHEEERDASAGTEGEAETKRHETRVIVRRVDAEAGDEGRRSGFAFVFGDGDAAVEKAARLLADGPRVLLLEGDGSWTEREEATAAGEEAEPKRVRKVIVIERSDVRTEEDETPR
jgi:hypothetical protein